MDRVIDYHTHDRYLVGENIKSLIKITYYFISVQKQMGVLNDSRDITVIVAEKLVNNIDKLIMLCQRKERMKLNKSGFLFSIIHYYQNSYKY